MIHENVAGISFVKDLLFILRFYFYFIFGFIRSYFFFLNFFLFFFSLFFFFFGNDLFLLRAISSLRFYYRIGEGEVELGNGALTRK